LNSLPIAFDLVICTLNIANFEMEKNNNSDVCDEDKPRKGWNKLHICAFENDVESLRQILTENNSSELVSSRIEETQANALHLASQVTKSISSCDRHFL